MEFSQREFFQRWVEKNLVHKYLIEIQICGQFSSKKQQIVTIIFVAGQKFIYLVFECGNTSDI
ncbi:hypothetical protein pb186bvf_002910 [Paramecium bursaria]